MPAREPHVLLETGDTRVRVALQGGEICGWTHAGRQLLWSADPAWWPRVCPVLFPVVGQVQGGQVLVRCQAYPMPRHGFAAAQAFSVESQRASRVCLALCSDEQTRVHYPFEFKLALVYEALGDGIDVSMTVTNTGDLPLPFALGLHPGFRWPFDDAPSDRYQIVFEQAEQPLVPVVTPQGLMSASLRPLPLEGHRLALAPDLFAADALCFLRANSRSLCLQSPHGGSITMTARNFPHWALWTRPGAPFLCMEAWTGYADPPGFAGELPDKPSMTMLAPGARFEGRIHMRHHTGGLA